MRALIWLGLRPRIDTSSAAVPATWGADMLVPRAPTMLIGLQKNPNNSCRYREVWLQAAHTKTSLLAGGESSGPEEPLPPGAATSMALRPKFVSNAGASTSVQGPVAVVTPVASVV